MIADKKREQNIADYIIYMYQTEDLLRAYAFDIAELAKNTIMVAPGTDEEKEETKRWYAQLAKQMKAEGVEEKGHLSQVQQEVASLEKLYHEKEKQDEGFQGVLSKALPHIEGFIAFSKGQVSSPVQICINGVYGLLIARMNGKSVDASIMESIQTFGDVLSYLNYAYQEQKLMDQKAKEEK